MVIGDNSWFLSSFVSLPTARSQPPFVQTRPRFAGEVKSRARIEPAEAVDRHFLDNAAGPMSVEVTWSGDLWRPPLIIRATAG